MAKGKRINTLIADDIEWTYLPNTKADETDEDVPENEGGNTGGNTGNDDGSFAG